VLALLLAGMALAQTPAPTIGHQIEFEVVRWKSGAPNSDLLVRNGIEIVMLEKDGLGVLVALTVRPPRQVALVEVVNRTGQRVEVVPSRMTLDLMEPEPKPFPYEDPDTLAASVRRTSGWEYIFVAMASMGTQQSHTTGMVGNVPVDVTTTTHDQAAEDRAIDNLHRKQERKAAMASDIERGALRENTVLPGEDVSGSVFFAAPKHYDRDYQKGRLETVLRVPVRDYVFEFPFRWEGNTPKKKSQDVNNHPFEFPLWWKAKK